MFKRLLSLFVIVSFFLTSLGPLPKAHAETILGLPAPGTMVNLSPAYEPVMIKGLTVHKDNPFLFDFIVDVGQDKMSGEPLKKEGEKLIKYFLASLAIPDKDAWVNLSPYEKNRMIPEALGQTDMGRDLLEQDYILKQITASLIYPEKQLGKTFWEKVYAKAQEMYGTTQIPVNTFNKVWIMADRAEVFEHDQTAFVVDQHLKVMLEEDYLALQKNVSFKSHSIASNIVRAIILPELEKEVNSGKNFANLRQIFNSIILASWYKKSLKEVLLNQVYADKSRVKGINLNDPTVKQQIYDQYLKAYKKGVFNYIKEDVNGAGTTLPRKYFSGGMQARVPLKILTDPQTGNQAMAAQHFNGIFDFATLASTLPTNIRQEYSNAAMTANISEEHIRDWVRAKGINRASIKTFQTFAKQASEGRLNDLQADQIKQAMSILVNEVGLWSQNSEVRFEAANVLTWPPFISHLSGQERELVGTILKYNLSFPGNQQRAQEALQRLTGSSSPAMTAGQNLIYLEDVMVNSKVHQIKPESIEHFKDFLAGYFTDKELRQVWDVELNSLSLLNSNSNRLPNKFRDVDELLQFLGQLPGMGKFLARTAKAIDVVVDVPEGATRIETILHKLAGYVGNGRDLGLDNLSQRLRGIDPAMTVEDTYALIKEVSEKTPSIVKNQNPNFVGRTARIAILLGNQKGTTPQVQIKPAFELIDNAFKFTETTREVIKTSRYWDNMNVGIAEMSALGGITVEQVYDLFNKAAMGSALSRSESLDREAKIKIYTALVRIAILLAKKEGTSVADQFDRANSLILQSSELTRSSGDEIAEIALLMSERNQKGKVVIGERELSQAFKLVSYDAGTFKNSFGKGRDVVALVRIAALLGDAEDFESAYEMIENASVIRGSGNIWEKENVALAETAALSQWILQDAAMSGRSDANASDEKLTGSDVKNQKRALLAFLRLDLGTIQNIIRSSQQESGKIGFTVNSIALYEAIKLIKKNKKGILYRELNYINQEHTLNSALLPDQPISNVFWKNFVGKILENTPNAAMAAKMKANKVITTMTRSERISLSRLLSSDQEREAGDLNDDGKPIRALENLRSANRQQMPSIEGRRKVRAPDLTRRQNGPGGIDLNTSNGMQWKVSKDGQGVEMNIDPAMIARIRREGIDSLSPVILRMTPVASIWPLVGLQAPVR